MKRDSTTRYGSVTAWLHWGMTALIGWQMLKFFDRIADGEHWVGETLVPWHISIGSLLLLLVIARLVWIAKQDVRPAQNPATVLFVRIGHALLYACMVLLPVTGILRMVGRGRGWSAFEMQIIPGGDEVAWMAQLGEFHSPIAWVLLVLLTGHVAITLLHHFALKDDTLRRIT